MQRQEQGQCGAHTEAPAGRSARCAARRRWWTRAAHGRLMRAAGEKARREAWAAGKAREVKELTIKARAGGPGARAGRRVRVAYAVDAWATLVRRARGRSLPAP